MFMDGGIVRGLSKMRNRDWAIGGPIGIAVNVLRVLLTARNLFKLRTNIHSIELFIVNGVAA